MIIGVPREIKPGEQRVALTPAGARALVEAAHGVVVERGAGAGSGIRDEEYTAVGAELVSVDDVWRRAELVLKVKEPLAPEVARLRPGQVLFTYLHLAPAPELTRGLRDSGAIAIAYETVQRADGSLPLLTPMSEVAGRLSVQEGAFYLGRAHGGRGILLSGVPGVPPGNVVILGAGAAGLNAAKTAVGLGADVSILDVNVDRLRHVDDLFRGQVVTLMSNSFNIEQVVPPRRPADRRRAARRRAGPGPRHQGDGVADEGRLGDRGHRGGPGRVRRDHPPDHLARPRLSRRRRRPLRRRQHAGARPAHVHLRAHERDASVCHRAGRRAEPSAAARANPVLAKGVNVWHGKVVHPGVAESLGETATPLAAVLG